MTSSSRGGRVRFDDWLYAYSGMFNRLRSRLNKVHTKPEMRLFLNVRTLTRKGNG